MPSYKVIAKGFLNGSMYDPGGKRRVVHVDKPFKKTPTWLTPMKAENAAQKKKREADEKKAAKAALTGIEDDKKEIAEASFLGDGESGGSVETL